MVAPGSAVPTVSFVNTGESNLPFNVEVFPAACAPRMRDQLGMTDRDIANTSVVLTDEKPGERKNKNRDPLMVTSELKVTAYLGQLAHIWAEWDNEEGVTTEQLESVLSAVASGALAHELLHVSENTSASRGRLDAEKREYDFRHMMSLRSLPSLAYATASVAGGSWLRFFTEWGSESPVVTGAIATLIAAGGILQARQGIRSKLASERRLGKKYYENSPWEVRAYGYGDVCEDEFVKGAPLLMRVTRK